MGDGAPRQELVAGEVVAVAPERAAHVTIKARVWRALDDAVTRVGLSCEAFIGGVAVEVDGHTVHEPDALVRCGKPLPGDALKVTDPVVVVEVLSPSTQRASGASLTVRCERRLDIPLGFHLLAAALICPRFAERRFC